jgi:hypothetical protein
MFDLHTIIKNNQLAEKKAHDERVALLKRELTAYYATGDTIEMEKFIADLGGK